MHESDFVPLFYNAAFFMSLKREVVELLRVWLLSVEHPTNEALIETIYRTVMHVEFVVVMLCSVGKTL